MSTRVRIYELSKELNIDTQEILSLCEALGIKARSHSSTITAEDAAAIRDSASTTFATGNFIASPATATGRAPIQTPSSQSSVSNSLTLQRTRRTAQGYIEPKLDVGKAIPLHMVSIRGSTFTMGSPDDEIEREKDEGPQHQVTLLPFFMGRYPVTQAQWRAVAQLPQQQRKLDLEPSHFLGDNRPVEQVSWHDAVEFCARLSAHTERPYRLPTEAEWEYACRADTQTPFYFGHTLTDELANYRATETYASGVKGEYREETTDVNYFGIANAFGLSDMHGNVLEWCQDHWHDNYEGAPLDGSAWLTDNQDASRMLRGGSWLSVPRLCRSAYRSYFTPVDRLNDIGFRVSCASPRALQ